MWSRKELKQKGKNAFNRNYWKTVLVAVVLSLIVGTGSFGSSFASGFSEGFSDGVSDATDTMSEIDDYDDDYDDYDDYDYDYDDQDDYSDMDIDEEFGVSGPEIVAIAIFVIVFIISHLFLTSLYIQKRKVYIHIYIVKINSHI